MEKNTNPLWFSPCSSCFFGVGGHTMIFVKTKSQGLSVYTILVIIAGTVQDRTLWYLQQSLTSQHGWPSENPAHNKRVFVVDKSHLSDNSPILEEQSIWYDINYIKKCWDTSKLQLLIYLNFSYAIHFQSASVFAFGKCDQPTKGFWCCQCQILQPALAVSVMAKQGGVCLPPKVAFKPTEAGHWKQWCTAAWSHSQPHPELIEVNFTADFVGTDSSSPSLTYKIPSVVLHPRSQRHEFRSGGLQNKCSCDKQVMIKGWVLFIWVLLWYFLS